MQATEKTALTTTSHPPKVWECHVDDVFSIIRNSNLHDFFQHINSLHHKTKFTMETEQNSQLPFLDTLIQRNSDNTISVRVYRKPTHTDQYLKFTSHHLARAKKSVIISLFDRAKNIISNPSDQEKEENHLTAVLQANSYPKKFISSTIRASQLPRQPADNDNTENQGQTAPVRINLPYVKGTSEQLKRIFSDHNINCTFTQLQHYVHCYHMQKILYPQSKGTISSINMTAKNVKLSILENQNEHLQRELKNTLEL